MRGRWVVGALVVVAALGGTAGGVALATERDRVPASAGPAQPVVAVGPVYPTTPPISIKPDPDYPPLQRDLPSHSETIGQKPFQLTVQIPNGWVRENPSPGEWRWYPQKDSATNLYFVRIKLIGNQYQSVAAALQSRIDALSKATAVKDFDNQSTSADTLVATYVLDGYKRVTYERFITRPGSTIAFASIGIIGREVDRDGMSDLLERITDQATSSPPGGKGASGSPSAGTSASPSGSGSPSASASGDPSASADPSASGEPSASSTP